MKQAIFLGDSITMGYALKNAADRFSTRFCEMANFHEVNYGICGTLMARAANLEGAPFVDRYKNMQESADLIVVFGGTNDYFWTQESMISPGADDDRYFNCAAKTLCKGLKAKYPGKPIIFILPYRMRGVGHYLNAPDFHTSKFHTSDEKNFLGYTLADYVNTLQTVCTKENIPVLDLFHDPEIDVAHNDPDYRNYTIDGCHPNENGHRRIAEKLYEITARYKADGNTCHRKNEEVL